MVFSKALDCQRLHHDLAKKKSLNRLTNQGHIYYGGGILRCFDFENWSCRATSSYSCCPKKVSVLVLGRQHKGTVHRAHIENYCCIGGITGEALLNERRMQAKLFYASEVYLVCEKHWAGGKGFFELDTKNSHHCDEHQHFVNLSGLHQTQIARFVKNLTEDFPWLNGPFVISSCWNFPTSLKLFPWGFLMEKLMEMCTYLLIIW